MFFKYQRKSPLFVCLLAAISFTLAGCTELELASHVAKSTNSGAQGNFKIGNPYTIQGKTYRPQESYDFTETGIASWYGPQFHGKQTANGEIYNMYELTAAHRTLQMPSLVRVTNLENGNSIIVRVNDRGPFSRGRVIDVSSKAADLLGMKQKGTAKVRLQLLSDESRRVAELAKSGQSTKGYEVAMNQQGGGKVQPTAYEPAMTSGDIQTASVPGHVNQGRFYPDPVVQQMPVTNTNIFVQVGAFSNPDNASALAARLSNLGAVHVEPAIVGNRNFYRVRFGPLSTVDDADLLLSRVINSGYPEALTVVD
jgi:rare lipoprotein A